MQQPQASCAYAAKSKSVHNAADAPTFHTAPRGHADRIALERFIAERYARAYKARVTHFADNLVGLRSAAGPWTAAVGFTVAGRNRLFVEQYLEVPVEEEVSLHANVRVERRRIVEVGNLAAPRPGAARDVIVCMTRLLHELGRSWVVLTGTRTLLNSFARLGIQTIELAPARPSRLADRGASWGSYYACDPRVIAADISLGYRQVAALEEHLHAV